MTRGMSMLSRMQASAGANELGIVCTPTTTSGSVTLTDWVGTPGRVEADGHQGGLTSRREYDRRDFTGPISSLVIGSTAFLPVNNMRFVEVINGISYTFEALPENGQSAWDYQDMDHTRARVRCKRQVT